MEGTEKIYTTDGGSNFANGALMGASLNRGSGYGDAAALMANQFGNNWMNNPFAYLMFMMIPAMWGGNGLWGNNGNNAAANAQLQSLQTQIADNHNADLAQQALNGNREAIGQLAQNFNVGIGQVVNAISATQQAISAGICNVRNGITEANGNIALSAQQMIANNNAQSAALGAQIANQGNGVQREILTQGYQSQLATQAAGYQSQIGNLQQSSLLQLLNQQQNQLISNGFTQIGFQSERNACDVREASQANTQRIIDTLNNHWNLEQQTQINNLRDEVGRLNQTNTLISALKGTATATSTSAA